MKSGYATKREMWVDVMVCVIIMGVFALMMVAHGGAQHVGETPNVTPALWLEI